MKANEVKYANLFNATSILLHRYLLCGAFKTKKGLNIQTS